jgi:L-threonylcarbamoyladenylate synthase
MMRTCEFEQVACNFPIPQFPNYFWSMDFTTDIENSLSVLMKGGIILYPTDTIWGIGCDATNEEAVEKIYALKQRPSVKSLIILVADQREVLKYVANPDLQVFEYLETAEKPTTVIYEGAVGLAENLVNEDGSIAIRIVKEDFCRHLLKRLRKPLVSTSANISSQPPPASFKEINAEIIKGVDYVVQYRQDDAQPASSSTIIRWNQDGTVYVLRP